MKQHVRAVLFCIVGGLFFTVPALNDHHFGWWWLAGVVLAASLLPVARYGPRNPWAQFGCMAAVLVMVGIVCTMSEGVLFFPETKKTLVPALTGGTLIYVMNAALLALLARLLRLAAPDPQAVEHRSAPIAIPMLMLSGLSYVLYYLVFGAIAFQSFTKQFYPHATEQVMALGNWFWMYQWGRGLLMTLAVLPIVYALRLPRWKAAIAVGLMVWLVGGGASLLVPSTIMVPAQRYAHILEIMTQNVSLGMTAVWLLRPKTKKVTVAATQAVTV